MKKFILIRIVAVNILLFFTIILLLDLVLGTWFTDKYSPTCYTEIYHHEYCAGVTHVKVMEKQDGGRTIESVVNLSSVRVSSKEKKEEVSHISDYAIINIGDSFIQADEVKYEDTIGEVLTEISGKRTLQIGYSSWAPIQIYNWLASNRIKEGTLVNIFLMSNDAIPAYWYSNISYHQQSTTGDDGRFHFNEYKGKTRNDKTLLNNSWKEKSFFISAYKKGISKRERIAALKKSYKKYNELEGDFSAPSDQCNELYRHKNLTPLTFDYLSFSFQEKCWNSAQVQAVNSVANDLDKIIKIVRSSNSKIEILLIPPHWALENEGITGKQSPVYKISERTTITTVPLALAISKRIGTDVIPLENILKTIKEENRGKQLYYPVDGHWTAYTHRRLGEWLASRI